MSQTNVTEYVLRFRSDDASQRKVLSSLEEMNVKVEQLGEQMEDLSPTSRAIASAIERGFERVNAVMEQRIAEVQAYRAELQSLDDVVVSPRIETERTEVSRGGGVLDSIDRFSSTGTQILSGIGQGEAANAVGLLGDVAQGFGSLNPMMLAVTAATAGLALVVGNLQAEFEEAKQKAEKYLAIQGEINSLVAGGATSETIQAQIDQNNAEITAFAQDRSTYLGFQQRLQEAQTQIAEAQDALLNPVTNYDQAGNIIPPDSEATLQAYMQAQQQEQQILEELGAFTNGNVESLTGLNLALEGNQEAIAALAEENASLQGALLSTGVQANNAAAELAEAQAAADAELRATIDAQREAGQLTAKQRAERVDALEQEQAALEEFAQTAGISEEYRQQLNDQIAVLGIRIRELGADIVSTADLAEQAAQALETLKQNEQTLTDLADNLFDAQAREVAAKEQAREATEAYNQSLRQHQTTLAKIDADLKENREKIAADTGDKIAEEEAKAAEDRAKAVEDSAKRRQEIEDRYNRTYTDAVAERDALGARRAKQQRDDDLKKEGESLDERLKAIDDGLQEQTKIIRKRGDEQVKLAEDAARKSVAAENDRWQKEYDIRVRANQQAIRDVQNAASTVQAIQANVNTQTLRLMELRATGETRIYSQMAQNADFWLTYMYNRSAQVWSAMAQAMAGVGMGGGRTGAQPTPFAEGGIVTQSGLAYLHAPEVVYPLRPATRQPLTASQQMVTNTGINISVTATTPRTIRREVDQRLADYFRRAGFSEY